MALSEQEELNLEPSDIHAVARAESEDIRIRIILLKLGLNG